VAAFSLLFLVHEPMALMVVAAFGGIGMAGSLALTSALSADIFGRFSVGSIFSLIFLVHQMGSALGAWLAGFLFDLSGGYGPAFGVSCALLIVGAGLALTINVARRPRVRAELQPVAGGG
jgi:MFS family permease